MEEPIEEVVEHLWLFSVLCVSRGIKVHLWIKHICFQYGPKVFLCSYDLGEKVEICIIIAATESVWEGNVDMLLSYLSSPRWSAKF